MENDISQDYKAQQMKNPFARHLVFSVLEILSIWPLAVICGIVACVFTSKANTSFLDGRKVDFLCQNKNAKISLWMGFASYLILLIIIFPAFLFQYIDQNDFLISPAYLEDLSTNFEETWVEDDLTGQTGSEYRSDTDEFYSIDRKRRYNATDPLHTTLLADYNQFTLEGEEFILPMPYSDFLKLNIKHDTDQVSRILNPSKSGYIHVYNKDDINIGQIFLYNNTSQALPMSECIIYSVSVDNFWCEPDIELIHHISFETSAGELTDYFGIPDQEFHSKTNPCFSYTWCAPLYEKNLRDQLSVDFTDGKIMEISITYIGVEEY